jgi:hypothetical protein
MKFLWPREIDADQLTDDNFLGKWETPPEDPLVVLVAHSDCEGEIPPDLCGPLADRLGGLVDKLDNGEARDGGPFHRALYDGEREATLRFIKGLREAAAVGEPVIFG